MRLGQSLIPFIGQVHAAAQKRCGKVARINLARRKARCLVGAGLRPNQRKCLNMFTVVYINVMFIELYVWQKLLPRQQHLSTLQGWIRKYVA